MTVLEAGARQDPLVDTLPVLGPRTGACFYLLSGTTSRAERLHSLSEKEFELGVKTHLDVEDALTNPVQAKGNPALARRDYLVARISLDYVMGVLGERTSPSP